MGNTKFQGVVASVLPKNVCVLYSVCILVVFFFLNGLQYERVLSNAWTFVHFSLYIHCTKNYLSSPHVSVRNAVGRRILHDSFFIFFWQKEKNIACASICNVFPFFKTDARTHSQTYILENTRLWVRVWNRWLTKKNESRRKICVQYPCFVAPKYYNEVNERGVPVLFA